MADDAEQKQKLSFLADLGLDENKVSEELISKVMTYALSIHFQCVVQVKVSLETILSVF